MPGFSETPKIRQGLIDRAQREAALWSRSVDSLLEIHRERVKDLPALRAPLEGLRNKRDTAVIKAAALRQPREETWARACRELEWARRDLRDAWRTVHLVLERDEERPGRR